METPGPSRPAAPAVVAVIVAHNPGPWFEDALDAVAAQDYPTLETLVFDAASDHDLTARVAQVHPGAFVRRLDGNDGYGVAANQVGEIVEGAAFYWFLHDDVAPDPHAVSTMVGEALRSNAGVVGAKLVEFDDPRRIRHVGEAVDKTGERISPVDPGEVDQEQHDAVRDVFVASGGAVLMRADLFHAIGGFDPGIDFLNDDLSLCWRAHLAGARVVVAPDARVRHVEAFSQRDVSRAPGAVSRRERMMRHRIRVTLTCYSRWHRIRVLPQAALVSVLEVLVSVIVGRRGQAGDVVRAWRWNLARRGEIAQRRAAVEGFRQVPDAEIRRLQRRGSARVVNYFRSQQRGGARSDRAQAALVRAVEGVRDGRLRWAIIAWGLTLVIVGFGSRHLLFEPIPAVGGFPAFDQGPGELFRAYLSGWRDVGLGAESPAPTAFGLLGVAGTIFVGAMGTLRRVLLLGSVLAGLIGAFRLAKPTGSVQAQAAALVVYGATPLAFDSIALARWDGLVAYAVVPWILSELAHLARWEPFVTPGVTAPGPQPRRVLRLGLLIALATAFAPAVAVLVVVVTVALVASSAVAGDLVAAPRLAVGAGAALVVSMLLHLPWIFEFILPGARWEMLMGFSTGSADSFGDLLRFDVGPVGASVLSIGVPFAAALPLLIGQGWRFEWALRAWAVAVVSWLLAWADLRGWLPIPLPDATVLLAPGAAALALAVGLGVTAFEVDLRAFGFGWRQAAAAVAGAALLIGAIPTVFDTVNGRWYLPAGDLDTTFAFMDAAGADTESTSAPSTGRALWVGDPIVLPTTGFAYDDDLAFAVADGGLPTLTDSWPGTDRGGTERIAVALDAARAGDTQRLGRVLAPMGIGYVVLPRALAPEPGTGATRPIAEDVQRALGEQLDMREVVINPAYVVYANEAAIATRTTLGAEGGDRVLSVTAADLAGATPVLGDVDGTTTFSGELPGGALLHHAVTADDGWTLRVDGETAERVTRFGWANGFVVENGGQAELSYSTGPLRYLLLVLQLAGWVAAIGGLVVLRRHRRRA